MRKPNPNKEAIRIKRNILKLEAKVLTYFGQAEELNRQLQNVSIHNETEKKYEYEPGGYLDREVFINKIVCKVCGKVIYEERTTGGFN